MIKNIILDVGKVLIAWDPERAFRKMGLGEAEAKAVADATINTPIWTETDRGVWPAEKILNAFYKAAPQYENEVKWFWEHIDLATEQFPYTKDWIRSMKEQGLHVYILSNYGEQTFELTKNKTLDFLPLTDGSIFSYTVKTIKPEAEIFKILLDRYELMPDECVFIDDCLQNIKGANAVGIHGIHFKDINQVKVDLKNNNFFK